MPAASKPLRCAIYTRKSSAEGLSAEFTSLDNQREFCAAYIASQAGEGWTELPARYDDGGYSGGTLARPALTELRADISAGRIDVIVVYKIDRLSRSLRDFANLVSEIEKYGVTFVSVTQSFNTASAMGRLTLNVLLSFAQFERELISERLKDFFGAMTRHGKWITGQRPFGYRVVDKRLTIDREEAEIVRWIFRRYVKLKSLRAVVDDLNRRGIQNRNGTPYTDTIVHRMLRNRVYRGERRGVPTRLHDPIVSESLWQRAAQMLVDGRRGRRGRKHPSTRTCLLRGKLIDSTGRICLPTGKGPAGTYRYYIDNPYRPDGSKPAYRMYVASVDAAVVGMLDRLTGDSPVARDRSPAERKTLVDGLIKRVEITRDAMTVTLLTGGCITAAISGHIVHPQTKHWRIASPAGEVFEFNNLSGWLRTNSHRFDPADLAPFTNSPGACRANIGLSSIRPTATKQRKNWKGWTWAH